MTKWLRPNQSTQLILNPKNSKKSKTKMATIRINKIRKTKKEESLLNKSLKTILTMRQLSMPILLGIHFWDCILSNWSNRIKMLLIPNPSFNLKTKTCLISIATRFQSTWVTTIDACIWIQLKQKSRKGPLSKLSISHSTRKYAKLTKMQEILIGEESLLILSWSWFKTILIRFQTSILKSLETRSINRMKLSNS